MRKKSFLILTGICLFQFSLLAQLTPNTIKRCSTAEKMDELRQLNPSLFDENKLQRELEIQNWIANYYEDYAATRAIITIPVVVQIFGNSANNQVTDNRVIEQIAVLNEDYRKLNSDISNVPSVFTSVAADCEIEFCLATKDENNNPTTGIIRNTGSSQPGSNSLWNPDLYLNLFVYNLGGGLLGYTYTPSNFPDEGVHIGYEYFGKTGASAPFNKGRTATHEVGHWLNLEHVWGDNFCGSDQVSDTPTQAQDNYGCPSHPKSNTCGGGTSAEMFMNYMDYTDDACMYMFTAGQKARMIAAINLYRSGLIDNGKCVSAPVADFSANQTQVCPSTAITFNNTSTGSPDTYSWIFSGGVPSSSTDPSPTITYNTPGVYNVSLTISNSSGNDTETFVNYITVNNCASMDEQAVEQVTVYPNPANETLTIKGKKIEEIELTDQYGRTVLKQKASSYETQVQLNHLSPGIYFLKVNQSDRSILEKIQILRR